MREGGDFAFSRGDGGMKGFERVGSVVVKSSGSGLSGD